MTALRTTHNLSVADAALEGINIVKRFVFWLLL
jgi:hypothetical protein